MGPDADWRPKLHAGPVPWPEKWAQDVDHPQTDAEVEALWRCVERGQPYGKDNWMQRTAMQLGLSSTLRPRGRPKKEGKERKKGS